MIGHSRSMNIESEPIHQIIWMIFSLEAVEGALSQSFLEDINVYHPTPILEDLQYDFKSDNIFNTWFCNLLVGFYFIFG